MNLAAVQTDTGWKLVVHHTHEDQAKITCPGDDYFYLTWDELEEALTAITNAMGAYAMLHGAQASLDYS